MVGYPGSTNVQEVLVTATLKRPAPTVELPNGKKYLASDVMERCKELEPVDA